MRHIINNNQELNDFVHNNKDKLSKNEMIELVTLSNMPELIFHEHAKKIIKKYYEKKYNIRLTKNFFM